MVSRALFFFPGWAPSSLPASQASISFGSTHPCTSRAGLWCVATFLRRGSSKLPDRITSIWGCCCSSSSCPPCPSCTWSCPSHHLSTVAPSGSCLCNFFWTKFSFRGGDGNGHSSYKLFFFPPNSDILACRNWALLDIQAHYVTWKFLSKIHLLIFSHLAIIKGKITAPGSVRVKYVHWIWAISV